MTTYSEVCYYNDVSMLGIRFKPAGITAFTKVPIDSFTNQHVNMTLIDSLFGKDFYTHLPELESISERIAHIDLYFVQSLGLIFEPDKRIIHAVDMIRDTHGLLPLSEVARDSCLSLRHFERRFKTAVGVTPKTFSKITKFKQTLLYLQKNKNVNLFAMAIDCGYYDHSHLTKEFKSLSGNSPLYYSK